MKIIFKNIELIKGYTPENIRKIPIDAININLSNKAIIITLEKGAVMLHTHHSETRVTTMDRNFKIAKEERTTKKIGNLSIEGKKEDFITLQQSFFSFLEYFKNESIIREADCNMMIKLFQFNKHKTDDFFSYDLEDVLLKDSIEKIIKEMESTTSSIFKRQLRNIIKS